MIYVSSACVRTSSIKESVSLLASNGYKNIELSGGTKFYPGILEDLFSLKEESDLNYLCHNYFPPPIEDFVLNLASLEKDIAEKSLDHCYKAIDWSKKLGSEKFGVHAGFLFNIPIKQVGKKIAKVELFEEKDAYGQFNSNLEKLLAYADDSVQLYIENNVISAGNFERFEQVDPFFFTSNESLNKISTNASFKPLIDVAHLKVSCNTLGLNFENQLDQLLAITDYVHISDNDGKNDQNKGLRMESELFRILQDHWQKGKVVTLEVYDGWESLRESYNAVQELNN